MTQPNSRTIKVAATLITLSVLSACSSNDNNPSDQPPGDGPIIGNPAAETFAFVASRATDFSSGQIERLSLSDGNTVSGTYPATGSDIRVDAPGTGSHIYQVGRFLIDTITRFSATDTSVVDYQLSVNGEDTSAANPYDLAFVNEDVAYLTRRSGTKLWMVDPTPDNTPATVEDFKILELDLGAYSKGTADNIDPPDMTDAIIVDNKLFVLMENLTQTPDGLQLPDSRAYLAVFDTLTNQEIDTNQSGNNLNGILLQTVNPTALQYNEDTGFIYVVGRGNFFESADVAGDPYTGGIEAIDPTLYLSALVLDDGTQENNRGFFTDAVILNSTLGYLATLEGYDEKFRSISTLQTFNPSTGEISEPIPELVDLDITTMQVGSDNHLWVGINTDSEAGFVRINLEDGVLAQERVSTQLVPSNIVFLTPDAQSTEN